MPIQFYCPACHRPIEVDDEAANQIVLCPYCNATHRAPASSNLDPRSATAVASAPASAPPTPSVLGYAAKSAASRPARIGWAALASSIIGVIGAFVYVTFVLSTVGPAGPNVDLESMQKEIFDLHRDTPWLNVVYMIFILAPFASFTLGIVALAVRERPNWPAIVSLCVGGACTLALCASLPLAFLFSQSPG